MATLVRIDDELYINLDTVTRIRVYPEHEKVCVHFVGITNSESGVWEDQIYLVGEQGARLLKWLDAGGAGECGMTHDFEAERREQEQDAYDRWEHGT